MRREIIQKLLKGRDYGRIFSKRTNPYTFLFPFAAVKAYGGGVIYKCVGILDYKAICPIQIVVVHKEDLILTKHKGSSRFIIDTLETYCEDITDSKGSPLILMSDAILVSVSTENYVRYSLAYQYDASFISRQAVENCQITKIGLKGKLMRETAANLRDAINSHMANYNTIYAYTALDALNRLI